MKKPKIEKSAILSKEQIIENFKKDSKNIGTLIDCCWQRYDETVETLYNPKKYKTLAEGQILLNQSTILSCLSYLLKEKS